MERLKVLVIHQDGLITGSGISLKFMLMGLDMERFQIQVVLAGEGPLKALLENEGFKVEVIRMRGFWTAPGPVIYRRGVLLNLLSFFVPPSLIQFVKSFSPDIIHLNDKALAGAGLALRKMGIPIVQHVRSTYQATHVRWFVAISKWAITRYASILVGISEDELEEFDEKVKKKVIFNSMDVQAVKPGLSPDITFRNSLTVKRDEKLITFIGMFSETKGAWDFLRMVGYYQSHFASGKERFMMVGPLPDKIKNRSLLGLLFGTPGNKANKILEKELQRTGCKDKIILTGYRSDILEIIRNSDVLVMCNRLGALGRQAFECMAVGTPLVITAGHSGKSKIVVDGQTAIVVPPRDATALAGGVRKILKDETMQTKLHTQGRSYAEENFDYRGNGRILEALYVGLINKNER